MPRYIDADKADVEQIACFYGAECRLEDVQEWLDEQPTADVVPREDYDNLKIELDAMRGAANSYKMHYEGLAREIIADIEPIFMSSCLSLDTYTAWNNIKEKYTKGDEGE